MKDPVLTLNPKRMTGAIVDAYDYQEYCTLRSKFCCGGSNSGNPSHGLRSSPPESRGPRELVRERTRAEECQNVHLQRIA